MNQELVSQLDKLLPVVVRVHGEHHPELAQVAELYARLKQGDDPRTAQQLRTITGGFAAPADACPTFQKVYADLAALTERTAPDGHSERK